jgi:hypothetical protein
VGGDFFNQALIRRSGLTTMPVANKINSTMIAAFTWSMVPGRVKQIAVRFPNLTPTVRIQLVPVLFKLPDS